MHYIRGRSFESTKINCSPIIISIATTTSASRYLKLRLKCIILIDLHARANISIRHWLNIIFILIYEVFNILYLDCSRTRDLSFIAGFCLNLAFLLRSVIVYFYLFLVATWHIHFFSLSLRKIFEKFFSWKFFFETERVIIIRRIHI